MSAQICHKTTSAPKHNREICLFSARFGAVALVACVQSAGPVVVPN